MWRGSKILPRKKKSCFLQKCDGSHLSSQWYPPSCPLSVQPTSFKRRAYQMGFSFNSLEAEELKHALQRDSSVSEITLNQNHAFNWTNCSRVLQHYKSQTAFNGKFCAIVCLLDFFSPCCRVGWTILFFFNWLVFQPRPLAVNQTWEQRGERMDGRMLTEDRWRWGEWVDPFLPGMCGSQAKEMLQPRREGISTWVTLTSPAGAGFCGVQIAHF